MELDDLKATWLQYDKKLSKSLKFNEELLRKMNLNGAKREFQKPLIFEIVNVVIAFLIGTFILAVSIRFINELRFSIPGILSVLIILIYFGFSINKVKRFLEIDYFGSSIVKLQKDIAELTRLILRIRKYELILIPFLTAFLFPLVFKFILNIDIYKNIGLLIFESVTSSGIAVLVTIWINKYFTDKKIKNVNRLLEEIKGFETEE